MSTDKFKATWLSYTSISDFLACPRAYYLKNVYRSPSTNNKMQIMSPPLALGQIVHEVIEGLSEIPTDRRFTEPLVSKFNFLWGKVSGARGGFSDKSEEGEYRNRGEAMLSRLQKHPGALKNLAVKISMELPYFWLSEAEELILCGKLDWIEYLKDMDAIHIIDFKTSRREEKSTSLQLPIYLLLAKNCQKRPVAKISYWYLDKETEPLVEKEIPDYDTSFTEILDIGRKVKTARKLGTFKCPQKDGCFHCRPFERVLKGEGTLVGNNSFGQDVYTLRKETIDPRESIIL